MKKINGLDVARLRNLNATDIKVGTAFTYDYSLVTCELEIRGIPCDFEWFLDHADEETDSYSYNSQTERVTCVTSWSCKRVLPKLNDVKVYSDGHEELKGVSNWLDCMLWANPREENVVREVCEEYLKDYDNLEKYSRNELLKNKGLIK